MKGCYLLKVNDMLSELYLHHKVNTSGTIFPEGWIPELNYLLKKGVPQSAKSKCSEWFCSILKEITSVDMLKAYFML